VDETRELLRAAERFRREGTRFAVATIVATEGSTYRRPGTRLLVSEHGERVGVISGGCAEAEVERVAGEVVARKRPHVMEVDHRDHDEAAWGWGLGCSGAMVLLIEPGDDAPSLESIAIPRRRRQQVAFIIVVTSTVPGVAPGAHLVVEDDGSWESGVENEDAVRVMVEHGRRALAGQASGVVDMTVGGQRLRAFIEVPEVPVRLLICGTGPDTRPLASAAVALGWDPLVVEDRDRSVATPAGTRFIPLRRPIEVRGVPIDRWTAAVIVTHHFFRDREYLSALVGTSARYIGVLGARARLERLLADLAADGHRPTVEQRARIHGPAGLDIGAETPEEIALAIVAEILSVCRERRGGPLREQSGRIHERRVEHVREPAR
jgi:xanthine dehydrogenase accessory factor